MHVLLIVTTHKFKKSNRGWVQIVKQEISPLKKVISGTHIGGMIHHSFHKSHQYCVIKSNIFRFQENSLRKSNELVC